MSQVTQIAEILRRKGRISNFDAIEQKLSLRLGARIRELREKGWAIRSEIHEKNCWYILESDPTTPPKVQSPYQREVITNLTLIK